MQLMKTYEICYKSYFHELKTWNCDYIKAKDHGTALRKFSAVHKIPKALSARFQNWQWWEGDWYMALAYIKPVAMQRCGHCNGTGKISVDRIKR